MPSIEKGLCALIRREIGQMTSRPLYLFALIIAPLFCLFFFTTLMQDGLPENLPLGVVDLDHSSSSRNLVRQLNAFELTAVTVHLPSFEEGRTNLQKGKIYALLIIPEGFQKDAVSGKQPKVSFYTNDTYLVAGSLSYKNLRMLSVLANGAVVRQMQLAKGAYNRDIMKQLQPIVIDTHPLNNPWLNYSYYLNNVMIPGVLQLLVLGITVFCIGSEIKNNTARNWLNTGRGSIILSLAGKLLPYTVIFFLVGACCNMLLYAYLDFPLNCSIWVMFAATLMLVISSQLLAVFMIGCLPTLRLGLSFASLVGMVSFSITGFSFPVFAMYEPFQWAANLFPLRHYFLIYGDQALNGIPLYYSRYSFLALGMFVLLPLLILPRLKKALYESKYKP